MHDLSLADQDRLLPSDPQPEFDMFRSQLNAAYYPAFVDVRGGGGLVDPRLNARALSRMTVGFVRFGGDAVVDPGRIDGYHLNLSLAGAVASQYGEQTAIARPGRGAVFGPNAATRLPRWSRRAAQICIKIDRAAVREELELIVGRPITRDVDFDLAVSTERGPGSALLHSVLLLLEAIATQPAAARALSHLERVVIDQLLYAGDHDGRQQIEDADGRLLPSTLRRVLSLIESEPEVLRTTGDLARFAGVGVRRLEQAFREHLGTSPASYQTRVRLRHAHDELLQPGEDDTVTSIMVRWGFTNHARFAAAYRREFDRNPADTLRVARRR